MDRVTTFVGLGLAVLAAAGAWGADYVVEKAPAPPGATEPAAFDDTVELKWDSGTGRWQVVWFTGRDSWVGNDFDISTLSAYRAVQAIKVQTRYEWPNARWDGFRIGVFSFAGGVPGSLLWGPKFVLPTGPSGWKEFSVNWTLPPGVNKFLAGQEQFYNHPSPGADPYMIDDNRTFLQHSWQYYGGIWKPLEGFNNYQNLMLRVIVDYSTVTVAPASVGRVKALYY